MTNCKWCEGKGFKQEGKGVTAVFYACQLCREMKTIKARERVKRKRKSITTHSHFYRDAEYVMVGLDRVKR